MSIYAARLILVACMMIALYFFNAPDWAYACIPIMFAYIVVPEKAR